MQHFDKTIKPKNSQRLAKHILTCEKCRKLYILMDEATETTLTEAPETITKSVMEAVRKIPVIKADEQIALRIIWGLSALVMGILLFFVKDLSYFSNISLPPIDSIVNTFDFTVSVNSMGFSALLLATMMAVLLYVLHNEEQIKI